MSAPQSQTDDDDNEAILVSEFPPPPTYFRQAAPISTLSSASTNKNVLLPPPIPNECFEKAAQRVAKNIAEAKASAAEVTAQETSNLSLAEEVATGENENEDVVGVFGEVVEDPVLLTPLVDLLDDPIVVRDTVIRLNKEIMLLFVTLIDDLVNRPLENKKTREEISNKVFLMLQECNKFREHQSREILIEILQKQLSDRQNAIEKLRKEIEKVDTNLFSL